jgi:hypothetical protein
MEEGEAFLRIVIILLAGFSLIFVFSILVEAWLPNG